MTPWILLALGLIVAAALGLVGLDRIAVRLIRPGPWPLPRRPEELDVAFEEVTLPSGTLELRGWLLEPVGTGAATVLTHGWGANSGEMLLLGAVLARAGHPVLVFDVRSHGRSPAFPGVTVRHFRDDILAASRWLASRFPDRPRALIGHSMGGAMSVLAAAEGAAVDAVAHLAAPADVLEVMALHLTSKGAPGGLLARILLPFWERRAGETFEALAPERRAADLKVPLLIVSAGRDRYVPADHAERMARAPDSRVVVLEDAGHFDVLNRRELHREVLELLRAVEEAAGHSRSDSSLRIP